MKKKLTNEYDLSLSLMTVVMAVILVLSGCSFITGIHETEVTESSAVSPEVVAQETAEPSDIDSVPSVVSYKAGSIQPFDQQKFDAAIADGKTVFLDFYAPWCPTCRANEPIVDEAFSSSDVIAFRVDYDSATELRKKYSVVSQSTYIVLKGGQELDRYLGALTTDKMAALLGYK